MLISLASNLSWTKWESISICLVLSWNIVLEAIWVFLVHHNTTSSIELHKLELSNSHKFTCSWGHIPIFNFCTKLGNNILVLTFPGDNISSYGYEISCSRVFIHRTSCSINIVISVLSLSSYVNPCPCAFFMFLKMRITTFRWSMWGAYINWLTIPIAKREVWLSNGEINEFLDTWE